MPDSAEVRARIAESDAPERPGLSSLLAPAAPPPPPPPPPPSASEADEPSGAAAPVPPPVSDANWSVRSSARRIGRRPFPRSAANPLRRFSSLTAAPLVYRDGPPLSAAAEEEGGAAAIADEEEEEEGRTDAGRASARFAVRVEVEASPPAPPSPVPCPCCGC